MDVNSSTLDRFGNLIDGTFGEEFTIGNVTIPAHIKFSNKKNYSVGTMLFTGGYVTDGDREYESGFMQLYKNGVIAWGVLNKPTTINGQEYAKGTFLSFNESGELLESNLP